MGGDIKTVLQSCSSFLEWRGPAGLRKIRADRGGTRRVQQPVRKTGVPTRREEQFSPDRLTRCGGAGFQSSILDGTSYGRGDSSLVLFCLRGLIRLLSPSPGDWGSPGSGALPERGSAPLPAPGVGPPRACVTAGPGAENSRAGHPALVPHRARSLAARAAAPEPATPARPALPSPRPAGSAGPKSLPPPARAALGSAGPTQAPTPGAPCSPAR
jgi:hypothetical protein